MTKSILLIKPLVSSLTLFKKILERKRSNSNNCNAFQYNFNLISSTRRIWLSWKAAIFRWSRKLLKQRGKKNENSIGHWFCRDIFKYNEWNSQFLTQLQWKNGSKFHHQHCAFKVTPCKSFEFTRSKRTLGGVAFSIWTKWQVSVLPTAAVLTELSLFIPSISNGAFNLCGVICVLINIVLNFRFLLSNRLWRLL